MTQRTKNSKAITGAFLLLCYFAHCFLRIMSHGEDIRQHSYTLSAYLQPRTPLSLPTKVRHRPWVKSRRRRIDAKHALSSPSYLDSQVGYVLRRSRTFQQDQSERGDVRERELSVHVHRVCVCV